MDATAVQIIGLTGKLVEYYSTQYGSGVFTRKGHGLQLFEDFLRIVFASTSTTFKENVKRCYKVNLNLIIMFDRDIEFKILGVHN